ncbi:glycosyl hydrolase family 18 protein, partial [Salmonella enterica subsp. enterica serovar Oslo]|uniref:glycosyl hydrolase family 18 protein n=1 Tax=Salmonella enterica TaxID=28901 RepID=UPI00288DA54C
VTAAKAKVLRGALSDMQAKAKAAGHTLALSMRRGGWSMSNGFLETSSSDSSSNTFANGVVKLFKHVQMFSEVDIDWEYQNDEGAGQPFGPEDGANYALLNSELRKQMDSAGLSNVTISSAASAETTRVDHANVK